MKITEKQLRQIIRESISELSTDTIDSARDAARRSFDKARANADPLETKRREEQLQTFGNEVNNRMNKSDRAMEKIMKRRAERRNGQRTYQNGKWQTIKESQLAELIQECVYRALNEHEFGDDLPLNGEPEGFDDENYSEYFNGLDDYNMGGEDIPEETSPIDLNESKLNQIIHNSLKKILK